MTHAIAVLRAWHRQRQARLPWKELEAEAQRQGCSPADIFFDRAGRQANDPAQNEAPPVPDVEPHGAERDHIEIDALAREPRPKGSA